MPVSPTQKHDLLLIKKAFEDKAREQDTRGATLLPMVTTVQQTRRVHETIKAEAETYPSVTARNPHAKNDQSFLKQKQIECIPCLGRIRAIGDLDMVPDLFATLLAYNGQALKNMLGLFKSITVPNRIQQALCEAYIALRSQCIPDISRLLSQLTLLMNEIKSVRLKSLKKQLIEMIGALIARSLIFGAINYDMYINLITDVTRCIAHDINNQIAKLEPILSRDGLEEAAELIPNKKAQDKVKGWFPEAGDYNHAQTATKSITNAERALEKGLASATDEITGSQAGKVVGKAGQISRIINDEIEESIALVDTKLKNGIQELLKFLKLSDANLSRQIAMVDQIMLIQSILQVLRTIRDTRGDFDPCGKKAGKNFFTKIKFPGQDVVVDTTDPENPEITILPPTVKINNPVVEEILNENGIDTGPVKSGRVVASVPISINVAKCLDGKQ